MPDCTLCLENIPVGETPAWCVERVPAREVLNADGQSVRLEPERVNVPNYPYHRACAVQMVQGNQNGAGGHQVIGFQMGAAVTNGYGLILRA